MPPARLLERVNARPSPEASEQINARLILLLANQVGDQSILEQALAIAGHIESENDHDN